MWVPISSSMLTRLLQWLSTQVQEQGVALGRQLRRKSLEHGSPMQRASLRRGLRAQSPA